MENLWDMRTAQQKNMNSLAQDSGLEGINMAGLMATRTCPY